MGAGDWWELLALVLIGALFVGLIVSVIILAISGSLWLIGNASASSLAPPNTGPYGL